VLVGIALNRLWEAAYGPRVTIALTLAWFGVRAADRRGRIALAVAVTISFLGPILHLFAAVIRDTGFGLQGRDYLPIVALLPLLAFELIRHNPPPRGVAQLFAIVALRPPYAVYRVVDQLTTLRRRPERTMCLKPRAMRPITVAIRPAIC
jgi:hypothetical protein